MLRMNVQPRLFLCKPSKAIQVIHERGRSCIVPHQREDGEGWDFLSLKRFHSLAGTVDPCTWNEEKTLSVLVFLTPELNYSLLWRLMSGMNHWELGIETALLILSIAGHRLHNLESCRICVTLHLNSECYLYALEYERKY